jgi:DNA-binding NtrC family response regulator
MLIGSPVPSHPVSKHPVSKHPGTQQPIALGINSPEDSNPTPFICVSSNLQRLLLQIEITAPRLQLASIEGEAGTGKHLLAQYIHRLSPLATQPFRRRDAREWLANEADASTLSGTLYLDRVDLLASAGQGLLLNLLKILQNDSPPAFLLLVSAHTALRNLSSQGLFLPDLAFRLTTVRFSIPPLHEHREDIAPITQSIIDRVCRRYQQPTAVLAPGTLSRLLQHPWPGNVRELASVLESAILDSGTGIIHPSDLALQLPYETSASVSPSPATARHPNELPGDLSLDAAIHRHIHLVLELNRGNKLRAARQLRISRSTLYRLLSGATIATEPTLDS